MNKWLLVPIGVVVLGLSIVAGAFYSLYGHQDEVADRQSQLQEAFDVSLGEGVGVSAAGGLVEPPAPLPGHAVARVTIPSLGQEWVVVEGTAPGDIAAAPGHYSFSAMPGQKGNFAVAGHREPGLFWDLDKVRKGDVIMVQSRKGVYKYVVTHNIITHPQSWPEVQTTPPGFTKGDKVLTLTTCNPKWDNYERLVIHAELVN